ncbi:thiamine transporter 1-like isoform X2 [Adelges cooleyi]|uniref:thiamine transporter 1-like isoform X2 n=1 Tax=Adelges cooleyi TaxID=133065 RepID=UPI00218013C5|nr:thiamine transporter 1-like isoform X2 [Adelges cooleyi]
MEETSWKQWKYVAFLVCVFAMVREIRPIEPFFTSFLISANFTREEINEQIYAIGTYSCLVLAVVMFMVTDYFRYKPLIVADGVAGIFTYALLVGTPSLNRVKVDDKQYYQKVTSIVKASTLFGRFLSGLISQTIVSTHVLDYSHLLFISIFCTSFVTIWACFLPKVEHSVYFHKTDSTSARNSELKAQTNEVTANVNDPLNKKQKPATFNQVRLMLLNDFKSAYSNSYVAKKCFWWIAAITGYIIVATYIQVLWEDVAKENNSEKDLMNGAVESVHTICGAAGAYAVGYINYDWKTQGDIIFAIGSAVLAFFLYTIYFSHSLWILYTFYVLFGASYQIMSTITASEVAKYINPDSYGLIFGFNMFVSLLVISIFTLLFIQGIIIAIGTRHQILTIAVLFTIMGVLFAIIAVKRYIKQTRRIRQ